MKICFYRDILHYNITRRNQYYFYETYKEKIIKQL